MSNPNVGIQGVNSSGKLKRCLTDESGRLLTGSAGGGFSAIETLITTAPAYAINDVVGGEDAIGIPGGEAVPLTAYRMDSISLADPAAQAANLLVHFFAAGKAATGATVTDNAAFVWTAGARAAWLGAYEIQAADWKTVNGTMVATLSNVGLFVKTDVNSQFYMVITSLGAPNFGNGFLYVKIGFTRMG